MVPFLHDHIGGIFRDTVMCFIDYQERDVLQADKAMTECCSEDFGGRYDAMLSVENRIPNLLGRPKLDVVQACDQLEGIATKLDSQCSMLLLCQGDIRSCEPDALGCLLANTSGWTVKSTLSGVRCNSASMRKRATMVFPLPVAIWKYHQPGDVAGNVTTCGCYDVFFHAVTIHLYLVAPRIQDRLRCIFAGWGFDAGAICPASLVVC